MSYVYCKVHNTITPWGCPQCRSEAMRLAMAKAIAKTKAEIRAAFQALDKERGQ